MWWLRKQWASRRMVAEAKRGIKACRRAGCPEDSPHVIIMHRVVRASRRWLRNPATSAELHRSLKQMREWWQRGDPMASPDCACRKPFEESS